MWLTLACGHLKHSTDVQAELVSPAPSCVWHWTSMSSLKRVKPFLENLKAQKNQKCTYVHADISPQGTNSPECRATDPRWVLVCVSTIKLVNHDHYGTRISFSLFCLTDIQCIWAAPTKAETNAQTKEKKDRNAKGRYTCMPEILLALQISPQNSTLSSFFIKTNLQHFLEYKAYINVYRMAWNGVWTHSLMHLSFKVCAQK